MVETQILVVEDEIIVAEDIRTGLQNMGYAVPSTASSGEEAMKKAQENNPDLVLMDIVLQGEMDGIEAANQIRSRFDIPVVFLTAYSDTKTLERAKITEPFGYIIKPFKERELNINIEIALFKHRMEKKLKESKEWFVTTLKSTSDAVIATDPEGCVKFMNPVARSLTGWESEEAYGRPLKDVFNISGKSDEQLEEPPTRGNHEKDAIKVNQTVLIARNKTKIPIEVSSDPIRDNKGNINGIVMVFHDITERKDAIEAIINLKEFYESVLEGIVNGIWVTDENDVILYANKVMATLIPRQIVGGNVLIEFHEHFRPWYLRAKETLQPIHYQAVPFIITDNNTGQKSGWLIPRVKAGKFNGMICTIESTPGQGQKD